MVTFQKCFSIVFADYLKSQGFLRKASLFYRMNGDILQGVSIHKGWDESVTVGFFPYWLIHHQTIGGVVPDITRGVWADEWRLNSSFHVRSAKIPGELDFVVYDTGDNMMDRMLATRDKFDRSCLPLLDRVSDLDSFLQETAYFDASGFPGLEGTRLLFPYSDYQYPLLLKAYRERSFDGARRIAEHLLDEDRKKQMEIAKRDEMFEQSAENEELMAEIQKYMKDFPGYQQTQEVNRKTNVYEQIEKRTADIKERVLSKFYEKADAGDLDWICDKYEVMAAEAKVSLLRDLKLKASPHNARLTP